LKIVSARSESIIVFGCDYVTDDTSKVKTELSWQSEYGELEAIAGHAWAWEKELAKIN
jgi:UDP-glucose 4-epimerase